ncbi:hypothetical protein [Streptomyces sp. NBC_00078]|uniref:hypothetical protein n=1 Tax=unclassified Streptomyces TaxID=2593676 RepID=UPI00224DF03A|nr:hypothetical protein [Streptomyces sp. NBC_00078]MCX5419945.1 hypothetical protein [Streptomyces sp. NBC_00078]
MTKQTEVQIVVRARHTGARVRVEDDRFHCEGCGGGYADADPLTAAREHARDCLILPLS